jgi:hypothetical protein
LAYAGEPEIKICSAISPKTKNAGFIAHAREGLPNALDEIDRLRKEIERLREAQRWIPVGERLPKTEMRVQVCAETRCSNGKVYRHITNAMYEDGTVWREDSDWNFNNFDNIENYDEEQDDWRIPEGWWEYTIYNNDEGNCPIDDFVTHWRPLPKPPEGVEQDG